ncbi:MAG TPA: transglutaminase-like domain-containing protein [Solirubrobacteraceae bacterium]|nr:transglutaminase-like domain-containing protein [Solirubrobacteraceae bacterium]
MSVVEPRPLPNPGAPTREDLKPTAIIDTGSDRVQELVEEAKSGEAGDRQVAARLFRAVRDRIRYDPFDTPTDPAAYRASSVLEAGSGYCIQKSIVLTASARAAGIPSRLGFADVKNHLQSERLREKMGTDLFIWHGYSTLFVDGRWTKASCAFNAELCERFGVEPLEYDGTEDALLHPFTGDGSRYMEYVRERGIYTDLPLQRVLTDFRELYGFE